MLEKNTLKFGGKYEEILYTCLNYRDVMHARVHLYPRWFRWATEYPKLPELAGRLHSYQTSQFSQARPSPTSTGNYRTKKRNIHRWMFLSMCLHKAVAIYTPRERIHSNRSWLFQASVKKNLHLCAVEVGHRNCFGSKVRPVQVFIDPVHSDAHRSLDMIYHFAVCADFPLFVQHSTERYKIRRNVNNQKS